MKKEKIKKLEGEGELDYDYLEDILFFKTKNREYVKSIQLPNSGIVIDLDKENFIVGIQIFDASKFLGIPKIRLREIKNWSFNATIKENRIEIRLGMMVMYRGVRREIKPIITESVNKELPNSEMSAIPVSTT